MPEATNTSTVTLTRCTAETVPAFLEFIAAHNSLPSQHCLILDQNVQGIRDDFMMLDADPTERVYGVWQGDSLVAAIGLDLELKNKRVFFLGPWAKSESMLKPVLHAAMQQLVPGEVEELRTYHNVNAAAAHEAAVACGFSEPSYATSLKINKRDAAPTAAAAADCAVRLQDPSETAVTQVLLALHTELFPKTHFADEKWPMLDGTLGWLFGVFDAAGNRPIGYAIVRREGESNGVYIDYVGVAPSEQGKGRGTTLLVTIREWFHEQGFDRLALTVNGDNPNARKMYLKVGFQIETDGCGYKFFPHGKKKDAGDGES
ncbi:hypothetical protein HDU86_006516 [Geranomyces michiganensis]|nr:hypothetical protein HDU86_006516 [Geranomyces michiganensis]